MKAEFKQAEYGYTPIQHDTDRKLVRPKQPPILGIVVAAVLVAGAVWAANLGHSKQASAYSTAVVSITADGFEPAVLSIHAGQTVTWINRDSARHQPATDPYPLENALPGFRDPDVMQPNDSYSFTFTHGGTYTYHDHLNPYRLTGEVIVQ